MKRKFFVVGLICLIMSFNMTTVFAGNGEMERTEMSLEPVDQVELAITKVREDFEVSENLQELKVPVRYLIGLEVNGQEYKLYPVFENMEDAIQEAKTTYEEVLELMAVEYGLEPFSLASWVKYYDNSLYVDDLISENEAYTAEKKTRLHRLWASLNEFFDIFENYELNNEIVKFVNENVVKNVVQLESITDVKNGNLLLNKLKCLLPYNTGGVEALNEIIQSNKERLLEVSLRIPPTDINPMTYSGNSSFNISTGVTYARAYAEVDQSSENTMYGYIGSNKDCTNFVSQIKHRGGVPLYKTISDPDGWTFKRTETGSAASYQYTTNWALAEAFGNFFGTKALYASSGYSSSYAAFVNFSKAVSRGSFICYDSTPDGDWNHMGFVTAVSTNTVPYFGLAYKDFEIAQHSKEYIAYVSDAENGWETLAKNHPNILFGIIY